MFQERKQAFKAPPSAVRDPSASQDVRRTRALEEQKRRRAERIDSSRQLDFFADLTLGPSDDEEDDAGNAQAGPEVVREGISQFVSLLPPPIADAPPSSGPSLPQASPSESAQPASPEVSMQTQAPRKKKRRGKGRAPAPTADVLRGNNQATSSRGSKRHVKANKWADKCMYAELLEMKDGFDASGDFRDGIPDDIETGWVAVTPIPVGKRCLAVTHQTSGIAGVVPNTILRSRVLGKPLMKPFPSILPPQTVLDCILDENWRENGILHILDVITWKAQDLADCETPFRFWWRDTRLSELPPLPPPPNAAPPEQHSATYQFPHPTTFSPVPYHTNTTLTHLLSTLIPLTRADRQIPIVIPVPANTQNRTGEDEREGEDMDLDNTNAPPLVRLQTMQATIRSDGLLLYVSQATYEPGTSPLSSWVPLRAYQTHEERIQQEAIGVESASGPESPLSMFERLIRRRLAGASSGGGPEVEMDA
ncbi:hypothetical protein C8Q77DRAFT_1105097 [Trametes polyzona]|nr:hypothetical protein C8Q77DRAFT_1105097 [Trametes polyzona]